MQLASWTAALAGLGFGLSLIVVIGAQNSYLLRMGLRRERVLVVVLICTVSDALLIAAGVGGAGLAIRRAGGLLTAVRFGGAAFLLGYAGLALRRVLRPAVLDAGRSPVPTSLAAVVATTLALTWLNPGVYLDTVVLLGSVANTHPGQQWWFGAGAALASALWFTAVGLGARLLTPLFRRPRTWRVLDGSVAAVLAVTAARLLLG